MIRVTLAQDNTYLYINPNCIESVGETKDKGNLSRKTYIYMQDGNSLQVKESPLSVAEAMALWACSGGIVNAGEDNE